MINEFAYLWADGEYVLNDDDYRSNGYEPEHCFGYAKSDDYLVVSNMDDLKECRYCFKFEFDYLEFVEQVVFFNGVYMRLEQWSMVIGNRVMGRVYEHPVFDDGEFVTTSSIVSIDKEEVKTQNSVYKLGEPLQQVHKPKHYDIIVRFPHKELADEFCGQMSDGFGEGFCDFNRNILKQGASGKSRDDFERLISDGLKVYHVNDLFDM